MGNESKNRRIRGDALEQIMRDVLGGMQEFTCEVCAGSDTDAMEIIGVEKDQQSGPATTARIIPFPQHKIRR